MPDTSKKPVEPVEFNSPRATIYMPGAGHPFPPGSIVKLHPDDVEVFKASDLHLPFPEPEAEKEDSMVAKPAVIPPVSQASPTVEKAQVADKLKTKPTEG